MNQNPIFKFLSSVKFAVPLMLVSGACVSVGTIYESLYNSEYASLLIYKSDWFGYLLVLLWMNIFFATISRFPFKKHHLGFIVTHIGLLLLLLGGYITNQFGIDGQLFIPVNESSSQLRLQNLMLAYQFDGSPSPQIIKFKKQVSDQDRSSLKSTQAQLGSVFNLKQSVAFAQIENTFESSNDSENPNIALSFILKSAFFNVHDWLSTEQKPSLKMGPAELRIQRVRNFDEGSLLSMESKQKNEAPKKSAASKNSPSTRSERLRILDMKTQQSIKEFDLLKVQDLKFENLKIKILKKFKNASVEKNKIIESQTSNSLNPAIELEITSLKSNGKKETLREVLFDKFKGFSLHSGGVFSYKFAYDSSLKTSESSSDEEITEQKNTEATQNNPNLILFQVSDKEPHKARVVLYKNAKIVESSFLDEGQTLQTPWMGIQISLGTIRTHAYEKTKVSSVRPEKAKDLPPTALLVGTDENTENDFWLLEGEQKKVNLLGRPATIYLGKEVLDLPFELKLLKFSKKDYPGTNTPMSFESDIALNTTGTIHKISMNEPLKVGEYTIYQSSYIQEPGQTVSIFSVNKDPGRLLKYLGSFILCCGIIIITFMRSSYYKKLQKQVNL